MSGIVNCGYERCFKDIASTFGGRVFQRSDFFYCFDGKYGTAKRRVMAKISHSQNELRSDFLVLAASDRSKAEIIIAYPVCNIMEERSSVIFCSVNRSGT